VEKSREEEDEEREKDGEEDKDLKDDMTNLSRCMESSAPGRISVSFECRSRETVTRKSERPLFIAFGENGRRSFTLISIVGSPSI